MSIGKYTAGMKAVQSSLLDNLPETAYLILLPVNCVVSIERRELLLFPSPVRQLQQRLARVRFIRSGAASQIRETFVSSAFAL